jgi:hypothetical protein
MVGSTFWEKKYDWLHILGNNIIESKLWGENITDSTFWEKPRLSGHFWKNIICSRFRENNRIDSTF